MEFPQFKRRLESLFPDKPDDISNYHRAYSKSMVPLFTN